MTEYINKEDAIRAIAVQHKLEMEEGEGLPEQPLEDYMAAVRRTLNGCKTVNVNFYSYSYGKRKQEE